MDYLPIISIISYPDKKQILRSTCQLLIEKYRKLELPPVSNLDTLFVKLTKDNCVEDIIIGVPQPGMIISSESYNYFNEAYWEMIQHISEKFSKKNWFENLPDYKIDEELFNDNNLIGSGGFSSIYLIQYSTGPIIVKVLKENRKSSCPGLMEKELKRMQQLKHESILACRGATAYKNSRGIVLDYCPFGSISSFIKQGHTLNPTQKLQICYKIAKGIEFMHLQGICHFDIKPGNILLDLNLNPKIADFGNSRKPNKTNPKNLAYTLFYAAPEHLKGKPEKKSDVWSFAITIVFILTSRFLFQELKTQEQGINKDKFLDFLEKNKVPYSNTEGLIDTELEKTLLQCWELDPNQRPTMKSIRQVLGSLYTKAIRSETP